MAQLPLVSVIMPAYNAESFIDESIQCVLDQTFTDFELIVIDDGSIDKTKVIIDHYTKSDHRVKYIYQPTGRQGKARNNGLQHAQAPYIAFIDADDIWLSKKLEQQVVHIKATGAALVFSAYDIIDENGKLSGSKPDIVNITYKGVAGIDAFLDGNKIALSTVLARKDVLKTAGYFEESAQIQYGEDYFLWLRMLLNGEVFENSTETLACYRKHAAQSIEQTRDKALQIVRGLSVLMVPASLEKQKRSAIQRWIKRYLSANKPVTSDQLAAAISFIPSRTIKTVSRWCLPVIPAKAIAVLIKLTI